MACCAFAVFLLGQIAVFFGGLRVLVPRRFRRNDSDPPIHAATAWQLVPAGATPVPPPPRSGLRRWLLVTGLAVELAAGGVAFTWTRGEHPSAAPNPASPWTSVWCSGALRTTNGDR